MKEPSSLLIPINEIGNFSCHAHCEGFLCTGFWNINDEPHEPVTRFNNQGMSSQLNATMNGNVNMYTLTLTVNASEAMNNSIIQCEFEATGIRTSYNQSARVNLFVISSECRY